MANDGTTNEGNNNGATATNKNPPRSTVNQGPLTPNDKKMDLRLSSLTPRGASGRGLFNPMDGLMAEVVKTSLGKLDEQTTQTIVAETGRKNLVYEVKPYYSHSVLTATFFVYFFWSLVYFTYRGGWTLNKGTYWTLAYSISFLLVEFLSFCASILHLNNFTNPVTNILIEKLPDILYRQKKDFPPVITYICTYKEPPNIVSRTMNGAMNIRYPTDKLTVGLLDDSSNFRETRGWAHLQCMEKNFLNFLLKQAVFMVYDANPPETTEMEDPQVGIAREYEGILKEAEAQMEQSIKDAIASEVSWFVEYFLLNAWNVATEPNTRIVSRSGSTTGLGNLSITLSDVEAENELLNDLREDEFSPYRTFTEEDLECMEKFSIEGLQVLWHGSAFFRPLVRSILWRRKGLHDYLQGLNDENKLRYLTPEALVIAQYRILLLGREEVPMDAVSIGNIRIDFEPTGDVPAPKASYLRRRKPPIPHNKAGNINNGLFNESSSADAEFILLLDADQQPHKDILVRTLPYFYAPDGPTIAWIQTPQFFNNIFPADDPLGHRNMEFYGPVMEGRGAFGAAPFVGTNAVFKRSALCEIGGIMYNSVTEDMYTGMKLHVAGYKSLYHNEVLAIGSAPVDIKETLEQRKRWAQGAVEIFSLTPWSELRKKLGWRKMLFNLDSCIYPFLAPTAFFYSIGPFLMVMWAVPIVVTDPVLFVLVGVLPVMVLPRIILYLLLRAKRPHEEGRSGPALWVEANDMWRAEQTYFAFAGTYISSWHNGRLAIRHLINKNHIKGNLSLWNWNREFLKKPANKVDVTNPAVLTKAVTTKSPTKKPSTEQTFRTSLKESDQIKNTSLFLWNVVFFALNCISIALAALRFNCHPDQMWLLVVVAGFAFSTCWHLWSFIPMALRQNENQWPYASSFHAHNILIAFILMFLVFLFLNVKVCLSTFGPLTDSDGSGSGQGIAIPL